MLEELKKNKDFADTLYVCEVGRGIDILLASFVKEWKKIICFDMNQLEIDEVNIYFKEKMGLPIETFVANSGGIDFSKLDEKMIILANHTRLGKPQMETMKSKDNLIAIIEGTKL
jgi:hypothetical protein